jgi:hypothetical protein
MRGRNPARKCGKIYTRSGKDDISSHKTGESIEAGGLRNLA